VHPNNETNRRKGGRSSEDGSDRSPPKSLDPCPPARPSPAKVAFGVRGEEDLGFAADPLFNISRTHKLINS
jgi:hypothetical protein